MTTRKKDKAKAADATGAGKVDEARETLRKKEFRFRQLADKTLPENEGGPQ